MVGRAQRLLRVDLHPAAEVDEREEHVTQLVQELVVGLRLAQLAELLVNLLPHAADGLPIPAERRCPLLDLAARGEGRKGSRDTPEGAVVLLAALFPLPRLDRLPVADHLLDTADLDLAEDVRMAAHDLAGDGAVYVGQ